MNTMDAVQLDFFSADPNNRPMLLSAIVEGIRNDCGVFTKNVLEFMEGKLMRNYVSVNLCADGDFILFEFSYQAGNYGCFHPLCRTSHDCHRNGCASHRLIEPFFIPGIQPASDAKKF